MATINVEIIGTGPVGPQGEQGPQGIQGIQGATGPQGPKGDDGTATDEQVQSAVTALIAEDPSPVQDAVDEYLTDHPTVKGTFSNAAKYALLALLEKVAYIDEDGQEYLDTLETELFTVEVASISAVFNPGTTVIYTDDTLDSLKQYLTVTATYVDETTEVLSGSVYTLSGTLAAGTNTITVTYGGKTTTFTVTAVAPLYSLPNVASTTISESGSGSCTFSITNGLVSYSGNFGSVIYVDKNGNASTTRPTTEWYTLTQGAQFLFQVYDLSWTNGGTARTFHAKWCRSNTDGNVYTAAKDFAANSSGEDETAQFTSESLLSGPSMSGFAVQLNNGNANSTTVSFRIKMFVDGVRYF